MKDIRIGLGMMDTGAGDLDGMVGQIRAAEGAGFHTAWLANIFSMDAMTVLAVAGRETRTIELGTAVVPTFSRHPFYMAQQAVTTQVATGGRFVCGLGPSHKVVIENMLGLSFEKPARHVREYVTVLRRLVHDGTAQYEGETLRVNAALQVRGVPPVPILIGALGPFMRKIAGELCEGTITWMTGPKTLGGEVGPGVRRAAEAAGRPAPRIVAGLPVCLTDDRAGAVAAANEMFAMYGTLPSYRAMLDAEGFQGPGETLIAGDEKAIEAAIRGLGEAGVTDLNAAVMPFGEDPSGSIERTTALLAELARA